MKNSKSLNLKFYVLLAIFAVFGTLLVRSWTVPQTQTILKSYFNPTGARPGTNAYNELIDTMFWYVSQTYSNAQAAAVSAAAAQGSWLFVGDLTVSGSGSTVSNIVGNTYNVASITVTNSGTIVGLRADGFLTANYTVYRFNTRYVDQLDGNNYHANFSYPAMGANFHFQVSANSETQPLFMYATNFTRTNFLFYVACYNASQIAGLRIKYTGQ